MTLAGFKLRVLVAVCCLTAAFLFSKAYASQPEAASLMELTNKAELVFIGTCTGVSAHSISTPNGRGKIFVTTISFSVKEEDVVKGVVPETFEFTQPAFADDTKRMSARFSSGGPIYSVGKEYAVFLTGANSLGLRSTVALGYGRFTITTSPDGVKQVVNDYGNSGLYLGVEETKSMSTGKQVPTPTVSGPVDYDLFIKKVRELNKGK